MPFIPRPPLFWFLKLSSVILLIYPRLVIAITVLSSGIRSSMLISDSSYPMDVLLSSPYLSEIAIISLRMTIRSFFSSAKISFNSSILALSAANSCSIFSLSKPVSALRRISTIACACASERPKRSMSLALAAATFSELLIMLMTSSILSRAIIKPSKMCARASALLSS